jgi:hypothetical protein
VLPHTAQFSPVLPRTPIPADLPEFPPAMASESKGPDLSDDIRPFEIQEAYTSDDERMDRIRLRGLSVVAKPDRCNYCGSFTVQAKAGAGAGAKATPPVVGEYPALDMLAGWVGGKACARALCIDVARAGCVLSAQLHWPVNLPPPLPPSGCSPRR